MLTRTLIGRREVDDDLCLETLRSTVTWFGRRSIPYSMALRTTVLR